MTFDRVTRPALGGGSDAAGESWPEVERGGAVASPVGLAWCGIAVGMTQLVAPDMLARLLGVRPSRESRATMRTVGSALILASGAVLTRNATTRPSRSSADAVHAIAPATPRARLAARTASATAQCEQATQMAAAVIDGAGATGESVEIAHGEMRTVQHAITVQRPASELYAFWREFTNLPTFMAQLESVAWVDGARSHWITRTPGGSRISWDAEIVADVPGELIAWQSVPDAEVHTAATVRFIPTASGAGAIVHLILEYSPTVGSLGEVVARLFRVEPAQQLETDLEAFRRLMESERMHEVATAGGHFGTATADGTSAGASTASAVPS